MRGRLAMLILLLAATLATPAWPAPKSDAGTCTIVPMVFFDFTKSNLTLPARDVIAESIRMAAADHAAHMLVTGYCDSAEIARGCTELALRRANAVKAELVRLGKDEGTIDVRGSEELLMPTGPNVREPQNRRVTIDWD